MSKSKSVSPESIYKQVQRLNQEEFLQLCEMMKVRPLPNIPLRIDLRPFGLDYFFDGDEDKALGFLFMVVEAFIERQMAIRESVRKRTKDELRERIRMLKKGPPGLSCGQIANKLNMKPSSVKNYLYRTPKVGG